MPALPGMPYRGVAVAGVRNILTPANRTAGWVSFDVNTTMPSSDQATWEGNAGTSLTLRFRWNNEGLGSGQQAPNQATIIMFVSGVGQLPTSWVLSGAGFPAAGTEVTRTYHFDDDPLNGVLGALRAGTLELFVKFESTGGLTPWSVESAGTIGGTILAVNEAIWGQGYTRSRGFLTAHSISNASIGGAEPATFAYPDSLFTRITTTQWYRAGGVELDLIASDNVTVERTQALAAATGPNFDYSWTAVGGLTGRVGASLELSSALKDLRVILPTLNFGHDNQYAFASSGHQAGWTFDSIQQLTRADRITIDPRITPLPWAQKSTPRGGTNDRGPYTISADQLFVWAHMVNARGEDLNNIGVTEDLWNGSVLVTQDTSKTTGSNGWTPNAGVNWTSFVSAPAGNRRQDVYPNAPADAVGLGLASQTLGFSSAYTADSFPLIVVPDEIPIGEQVTILFSIRTFPGGDQILDAAPTVNIFSTDATTGVHTTLLATTTMTQVGSSNMYAASWTPAAGVVATIECKALLAGGQREAMINVTVRPRFDPIAFAIDGQLVSRM